MNNVVQLKVNKIYDDVMIFLNEASFSESTSKAYERDIREFFRLVKGKSKGTELEFLAAEDLKIRKNDIEVYRNKLSKELGVSNKTINKRVSAVRSLLESLKANEYSINIDFLKKIKRLPENDNSYNVLSVEEVLEMAELALQEREKGHIKHYLIKFALDTCIRKTALLNLKWSDLEVRDDCVVIHAIDKGNKDFRPKISKWFYEQLLTIKTGDTDKIFDISVGAVDELVPRLRKKMNISEERNVVFHSIRKAGAMFQYRLTRDPLQIKKALNHSDINTSMRYVEAEDYGIIGAVSSGGNINKELYKETTHEDLIKAIESMGDDFKIILNMKVKELMDKGM